MAGIAEFIQAAQAYGVFDFFLPFILMFAVIYGLLVKSKIFGEGKPASTINLVIALAVSAFIMIYPATGVTIAGFIAKLFGQTFVVVLTIISFLIVLGLIVPSLTGVHLGSEMIGKKWIPLIIFIILALAITVFISSGGYWIFPGVKSPWALSWSFKLPSGEIIAIIVMIVLLLFIIWFVARGEGGGKPKGKEGGGWRLTRD